MWKAKREWHSLRSLSWRDKYLGRGASRGCSLSVSIFQRRNEESTCYTTAPTPNTCAIITTPRQTNEMSAPTARNGANRLVINTEKKEKKKKILRRIGRIFRRLRRRKRRRRLFRRT